MKKLLMFGCAALLATSVYAAPANTWFVNNAPTAQASNTQQAEPSEQLTTLQTDATNQMEQDFNTYRLVPETYGLKSDAISQPYSSQSS